MNSLFTWIPTGRRERGLAIAIISVLVIAVASIGQVNYNNRPKAAGSVVPSNLAPTTTDGATPAPSYLVGSAPSPAQASTTRSRAPPRAQASSPASPASSTCHT